MNLTESASGEHWELQPGQKLTAGRSRDADIILVDENCSRRQFQLQVFEGYLILTPLSDAVVTQCNGVVAASAVRLVAGAEICTGRTRLTVGATEMGKAAVAEPVIPPNGPRSLATQAIPIDTSEGMPESDYDLFGGDMNDRPGHAAPKAVTVSGEAVIGRDEDCEVQLPHIQVSRRHASIKRSGDVAILRDLQSANGTYVDGRRIGMPVKLKSGARIGIGPYLLSWTGESLVPTTRTNNLQLEGRKLTRRVPSLDGEGMKTILDAVSVVVRPHEFVCLLGPTGSGKSTLLAALSARTPANSGQVLVNQSDLYSEFESLKRDIAVVPQHDILHDELTLEDALGYTARLRLPEDTSSQEFDAEIARLAKQVGLSGALTTKLGQMSGGQRRRASLANELLGSPSLLFLDEVTSGLDELTDRQMMLLFRSIADSGKTVVDAG